MLSHKSNNQSSKRRLDTVQNDQISSSGDGQIVNRAFDVTQRKLQSLSEGNANGENVNSLQQKADTRSSGLGQMVVQPKMKVGAANDPLEHEADSVASEVVKSINSKDGNANSGVLRKIQSGPINRKSEQDSNRIGKDGGEVSNNIESSIKNAKGGGSSLDADLQRDMGNAMGADFSSVKVHNDSESDQLNHAVGARAFTTGNDIFFKRGEYTPSSQGGQELIAHELTHVVQQGGESIKAKHIQREDDGDDSDFSLKGESGDVEFGEDAEVTTKGVSGNLGKNAKGDDRTVADDTEMEKTEEVSAGKVVTTEVGSSSQGLTEYGSAVQKMVETDGSSIKEATRLLARAGAFGEAKAKKTLETSGGMVASAEGSASGFAGAELDAVSGTVIDAIDGLTKFAKVSAKFGVGADLAGQAKLAKEIGGVELEAAVKAKLSGFAGAMAEAGGKLNYSATGMAMEGQAYAFAGAKAEGEVSASLRVGELGLEGIAGFKAMAGAEAEAQGKMEFGFDGVEVSGKAGCFAGTKVKAEAAAQLSYQGRVFLKLSGGAEASAGVGGEVEGTFSLKKGKLVIGGRLAATLGIGGGFNAQVEIDFGVIADMVGNKIRSILNRPEKLSGEPMEDSDREKDPEDQDKVIKKMKDAAFPSLKAYGMKKEQQFKQGGWFGSKNLVKKERIQEIIDKKIRGPFSEEMKYPFTDAALEQICHEAFGHQYNSLKIKSGVITKFDPKTSL